MASLCQAVQEILPNEDLVISLDRVLANLERSKASFQTVEVKNDPPPIYYSAKPAILVIFDGPPIWSPIAGTQLKYAVNTNWDLFENAATNELYLRNEGSWLKAKQLYGPWEPAEALPPDFSQLPNDNENWQDVFGKYFRQAVPGG